MVEFLLKSVFSVWYSHVFCYEPNRENPFDEMNAGWNLCNQRYGEYLFRLRNSVRFDIDKILPGENGVKKSMFGKSVYNTSSSVSKSTILNFLKNL